ncbi:alpha/beta hydrolase [Novosphingobium sp. Leaf2]|nr:alpha/beta hydrolase [Novosphingobium sp. Leaf2]
MSCFAKLHGRRSGAGPTVAILSHGFGTDQDAWSALRPWFEDRFDLISFDLAGCGPAGADSYDFNRHGSMFGYADDLIEIIDELGVQSCVYIGHSMSSMIGAAAACARPELFSRLVMIGASPRYLNDDAYVGGFEQAGLDQLFASMAANFQAWVAGFAPVVVGVDDSQAVADFSRTLFQMRPDVALNTSRTIFGSDMRKTARRVPTPVHLIQTAADVAVPVEVGEWLAAAMPDATLDVIDASGHLPHITAPDEVRRILEHRLAGIVS